MEISYYQVATFDQNNAQVTGWQTVCRECGAAVIDQDKHTKFHNRVERKGEMLP